MSKITKAVLVGAVLFFGGWYAASPYITLHQMRSAAEAKDADKLAKYIDFPSVKEALKGTFSAAMMAEAAKAPDDNPFAAAGMALGMAMIGPMVDAMVTPQAMAMMMKGDKPGITAAGTAGTAGTAETADQERIDDEPIVSSRYTGLNSFQVEVSDSKTPEEKLRLKLERDGLFGWKMTSVELPL